MLFVLFTLIFSQLYRVTAMVSDFILQLTFREQALVGFRFNISAEYLKLSEKTIKTHLPLHLHICVSPDFFS